jgi:hypothetical protein
MSGQKTVFYFGSQGDKIPPQEVAPQEITVIGVLRGCIHQGFADFVVEWKWKNPVKANLVHQNVFKDEIRDGNAHHFLCKIKRSKTKQEAFMECTDGRDNLVGWGRSIGEPSYLCQR